MNRALPGWAVDLIHNGVAPADLRRDGSRAVWSALVKTAMSAVRRGMDKDEWQDLISTPTSGLGRQITVKDRRVVKPLTVQKQYDNAWEKAWEAISEAPAAWTADEARAEAAARADQALAICANPDNDLLDADRTVLAHAADAARTRGITKVTLPRRAIADETGLGIQSIRNSLIRLHTKGLLILDERGRPAGPSAKAPARANVYQLPPVGDLAANPYVSGETPPVGSPRHSCGFPPTPTHGFPGHSCGFPPSAPTPPTDGRTTVDLSLNITATPEDAEAVLRFLSDRRALAEAASRPALTVVRDATGTDG